MKKCSVCGANLADEDRFCLNCGSPADEASASAPADEQVPPAEPASGFTPDLEQSPVFNPDPAPVAEAPAKKASKLSVLIPVIGVIAAVALVVVLISSLFSGGPVTKIGNAFGKTYKAASQEGAGKVLSEVMEQGSMEIKADLSKWDIGTEIDASVDLKLYTSTKKQLGACEVSVTAEGTTVDAGVYFSEDDVAVKSDALFGEKKVYGVSLKSALKNLPKSVLAPGETDYSLDEDTYDQIIKFLESMEDSKTLRKDMKKVLGRYSKHLDKLVEKHAEIEKASGSVSVGSKDVKTNDITIRIDGKAMAEILKGLWEKAEKDKELKEVLARYLDMGYTEMITISKDGKSGEELVDDLWDEIDENIDDLTDEMADTDVEVILNVQIGKRSKTVVAFNLKAKAEGETVMNIDVTLGENICTSELIKLKISGMGGEEKVLKYTVSENSKQEYAAKLTMDGKDVLRIKLDKKENSYKVSLAEDMGEIRGTLKQKSGTTTLTVDRVVAGEEEYDIDLQIIFKSKDSFSMPKYTEVLTMSEEDIETLIEEVRENTEDLDIGMMGSAASGDWEDDVPTDWPEEGGWS